MLNFLKKPYPSREAKKKSLVIALCTGVFVGSFLFVFRPFGLHGLKSTVGILMIFGYGVITFFVTSLFLYFIPVWFPKFQDDRIWTVGKEILYINIMILFIAAFNTLYTPLLSPYNSVDLSSFLIMTVNTFLVGLIPITFLIYRNQNKLALKYTAESESIQLSKEEITPKLESVKLEFGVESMEIVPEHLLYIESVGNYSKLVNQFDSENGTKLIRTTMKNLEPQIHSAHIIRCHRSYFVNLKKVIDVKGNAQGFKLSLHDCAHVVPVSRKYVPIVKAYFAKNAKALK